MSYLTFEKIDIIGTYPHNHQKFRLWQARLDSSRKIGPMENVTSQMEANSRSSTRSR